MDIWPFLMAASDYSDYRVVLCPKFIQDAERKELFRTNIDPASGGNSGALRHADVSDERLGRLSLYYNVIRVKRDGADAYDPSGRPLLRIEGIVTRNLDGQPPLRLDEAARLILESASEIDGAFEDFWSGKERAPVGVSLARSTKPKRPDPPPNPPLDPKLGPRKPERTNPPPKPPTRISRSLTVDVILVAALGVSVIVNAIYLWKGFWRDQERSRVQAELGNAKAELAKANNEIDRLKRTAPGNAGK